VAEFKYLAKTVKIKIAFIKKLKANKTGKCLLPFTCPISHLKECTYIENILKYGAKKNIWI
jgi:hypothetical protein